MDYIASVWGAGGIFDRAGIPNLIGFSHSGGCYVNSGSSGTDVSPDVVNTIAEALTPTFGLMFRAVYPPRV